MKYDYSTVCKKIISNYSQYLYEKEILALEKILKIDNYDNLNIIIFINKIIDRIWHMTLTNPKNYVEGKPFTFLVTRDLIPIEYNLDGIIDLKKHKKHFLEIVTSDNVTEISNGINGMIVEIDYINSFSEPVLPCDFLEKNFLLKDTLLNILGVYNISLNLAHYDAEEELSDEFAILTNLKKININKAIYNYKKTNKPLTKNDKELLLNVLIVYYLIEKNLDKTHEIIHLRDILKNKYKTVIGKEYTKYFNNQITLDDLINYVFNTLDNDIDLQLFDKTV